MGSKFSDRLLQPFQHLPLQASHPPSLGYWRVRDTAAVQRSHSPPPGSLELQAGRARASPPPGNMDWSQSPGTSWLQAISHC